VSANILLTTMIEKSRSEYPIGLNNDELFEFYFPLYRQNLRLQTEEGFSRFARQAIASSFKNECPLWGSRTRF
jgi:hypothetical protein